MKNDGFDPLYDIFEKELFHCEVNNLDNESFIEKVYTIYFSYLTDRSNTPVHYIQHIAADIKGEIRTMLKKKIYGYSNITTFLKHYGDIRKN
jgi:hypothetical protein